MMESVHRYEGAVNQVMGDGINALFGAPLAHEDHAVRACYAALRMQESVKRYAEGVFRAHGVPVQIGVGLNAGEVVVRSIGGDLHVDYPAVGQTTHRGHPDVPGDERAFLARLGITVALANNQFLLAEGLLVAGRLQDTGGAAGRALRVAHTAGPKAGALHVLCEVARLSDPPAVRMRPLAARCHLALGRALATSGDLEPARERLTTAGSMFEDRGMRFWLEQTTSELHTVGRTKHAAQG